GGETLGWEMVSQLRAAGQRLDRVFVQVGGGALASAVIAAFCEAHALGALDRLPRFHAVQSRGCWPLKRAWDRLSLRLLRGAGREEIAGSAPELDETRAAAIQALQGTPVWHRELRYAATHRLEFMWSWEDVPRSAARGILDDETSDWRAVLHGMLE